MHPLTSAYLDLVRLSAALVVVAVHGSAGGITGGFLWQIGLYGQTAVMAFFVLSGYVITYVANTNERDPFSYLTARAARLLSVVVPVLVVTLVCNLVGSLAIAPSYHGLWDQDQARDYLRYLATLLMLQDIWSLGLTPTNNKAFWTISFEFIYYLLFFCTFYLRGWQRVIAFLSVLLLGGPTIAAMFPIWLLGYVVYRLHSNHLPRCKPGIASLAFIASLAGILFSPFYREALDFKLPGISRDSLMGDYLDGIFFAMNALAAPVALRFIGNMLEKFASAISDLAGLTFSLYLLHTPLLRFFAGVSPFNERPGSAASAGNIIFVYLCTFAIVFLVGIPAERSKKPLQRWIRARLNRI